MKALTWLTVCVATTAILLLLLQFGCGRKQQAGVAKSEYLPYTAETQSTAPVAPPQATTVCYMVDKDGDVERRDLHGVIKDWTLEQTADILRNTHPTLIWAKCEVVIEKVAAKN